MQWTYFQKYDPRVPINDNLGRPIQFRDLGGQWGVLATADNLLIESLRQAQREERGGVMEITQAEYEDVLKKKPTVFFPTWRETVSRLGIKRMFERVQSAAVVVGKLPPGVKDVIGEVNALSRPRGMNDFVPKTVKRA